MRSPVLCGTQRNHLCPDAATNKRGAEPKIANATLNVGTLTRKGREIAAVMTSRKIDILCLRETLWTGGKSKGKARKLGEGCKLYYCGGSRPNNGVGICLSDYWQDRDIDVQRISERSMVMKLVTPGKNYNIVSAYAPQQGCSPEDKKEFWTQLESVISRIPGTEKVLVAGYINGHVGRERTGYERWHRGKTVGEGERSLKWPKCMIWH